MVRIAKSSDGFTLIEALVGMAVAVIGMFGILTLMVNAAKITMSTELRDRAMRIAEREMIQASNTAYDALADDNSTVIVPVRNVNWSFRVRRTVAEGTNIKRVDVVVEWEHADTTHRCRLFRVYHRPL